MQTDRSKLREEARVYARNVLTKCKDFPTLPAKEQLSLYKSLMTAREQELSMSSAFADSPARSNGNGLARGMAGKASDLINDRRHENRRIEQAGDLAGDFVKNVDFPGFVRDLLKGVFDANLEVTIQQMQSYVNLMKAATASIAKFVNAIDNTAAFGYLAENNSDEFGLSFDEEEKDPDGQPKAVLVDKEGNKLDHESDNDIKAKIMDAKIAMAKEQRALLRETILMGVSRLVVERGVVKASVLFDIKATENIKKADKGAIKDSNSTTRSANTGSGWFGKLVGGGDAGTTTARRHTQISLSSASSTGTTNLEAKLAGSVEIVFKSDYFKLDNFATMYGPVGPPAAAPGGAPGLPPGPNGQK